VSRLHCSLVREGEAVLVRDASRYGTFVNGERVAGTARLAAGDRLRLGTPGVVLELVTVS
jgi:pSer/pThr/pTyr-binding forkhead associated (FHA) protein